MSLVGWWKLEGNAEDSSQNGNDGVLNGSPSFTNGKIGDCINFDGSDDYVDIGDLGNPKHGTISLWFKKNNTNTQYLLDGRSTGNWWLLTHYNGYDINFKGKVVWNGLNTGEWYHVTVTATPNETKLYINGELKDTGAGHEIDLSSVRMGTRYNNNNFFNGQLDDVRIYDEALSEKRIKQLSRAKLLHYKFNTFAEYTENIIETQQSASQDWTKWNTYTTGNYWSNQTVSTDEEYGQVLQATAVSGTNYLYDYNGYTFDANTTYTFSVYMKADTSFSDTCNLYLRNGNGSEGGPDKTINVETYWKRFEWQASASEQKDQFGVNISAPDGTQVYFAKPQIEQKDHATPFVAGTREDTVIDSSGYNNNGELNRETPTWSEDSRIGSGCYSFDSDYIPVKNLYYDSAGQLPELTLSAWIRVNSSGQIIHSWDRSEFWRFGIGANTSSNAIDIGLADDAGISDISANTDVTDGNWHHAVFVYENGSVTFYLDGEEDGTASTGGNAIGQNLTRYGFIGDYSEAGSFDTDGNGNFTGDLDDIRIYHSALSVDEIQKIYRQRASIDDKGNFHNHNLVEKDNLTPNPSFEEDSLGTTDPTGWIVDRGSCDITTKEGRKCVHFPGDGNYNRIESESFQVTPGEKIYGRCWRYTESGASFYFGLEWDDGSWTYFTHPNSNGEWKPLDQSSVQVPEGVTEARIWVFNYDNNTAPLWVDDVYVSRSPIPDGFENRILQQSDYPSSALTTKGENVRNQFDEIGPGSDSLIGWWKLDGDLKQAETQKISNNSIGDDGNGNTLQIESITVENDGWHKVSYGCSWSSISTNGRHIMENWLELNGSVVNPSENRCYIRLQKSSDEGYADSNSGTVMVKATEGDTISLHGEKVSGTTGQTVLVEDHWLNTVEAGHKDAQVWDSTGGQDYDSSAVAVDMDSNTHLSEIYNHSGGSLEVNESGWYRFYYSVNCKDNAQDNRQSVRSWLRKNGSSTVTPSESYSYIRLSGSSGNRNHQTGYGLVNLSAGDYLDVMVEKQYKQSSGQSTTEANRSWLMLDKIKSNNFIQAYESGGAQSISSGSTRVILLDSKNSSGPQFSLNSNRIEFNKSGHYEISYVFGWDDNASNGRHAVYSWLRKNGDLRIEPSKQSGYTRGYAGGRLNSNSASFTTHFEKGDYIELLAYPEGGPIEIIPNSVYISVTPVEGEKVKDHSGNKNKGTVNGAKITSGLGQSAYSFDGDGDTIVMGDKYDFSYGDEFTLSAWIKVEDHHEFNEDRSWYAGVLSRGTGGGGYGLSVGWNDSDGTPSVGRFIIREYEYGTASIIQKNIDSGNFYHFVGVCKGDEMKFYVDSELIGTESVPDGFQAPQDFAIGSDQSIGGGTQDYKGIIQDSRVFKRALTTEEVKNLYNLTNPDSAQRAIQQDTGELHTKGDFNNTL